MTINAAGTLRAIRSPQICLSIPMLAWSIIGLTPHSLQAEESNVAPVIDQLGAVLYDGDLYVIGMVFDPDDDPTGRMVFIGGSVIGTTYVEAGGLFGFRVPYFLPYGEITVRTVDQRGAESEIAVVEFFE